MNIFTFMIHWESQSGHKLSLGARFLLLLFCFTGDLLTPLLPPSSSSFYDPPVVTWWGFCLLLLQTSGDLYSMGDGSQMEASRRRSQDTWRDTPSSLTSVTDRPDLNRSLGPLQQWFLKMCVRMFWSLTRKRQIVIMFQFFCSSTLGPVLNIFFFLKAAAGILPFASR